MRLKERRMKLANRVIATIIILSNIYYLYWTVWIIMNKGGAKGLGYLFLPLFISFHLLVINSVKGLRTPKNLKTNFVINLCGIIWIIGWSIWYLIIITNE